VEEESESTFGDLPEPRLYVHHIVIARTNETKLNQRNYFHHKLSRDQIDNYDLVVTEKLHSSNMVKNRKLARSISDASWSSLNDKNGLHR
jgi:putative transposase